MYPIAKFDFGNAAVTPDEGWIKLERLYQSSRAMWVNELRNRWHSETQPSPRRDIVFGPSGEFRLGLPRGRYRIVALFYDPTAAWKPFPIRVGPVEARAPRFSGAPLLTGKISAGKGEPTEWKTEFSHPGGPFAVSFPGLPGEEAGFFCSGLELYSENPDVRLEPMYPEAPPDFLPDAARVDSAPPPDLRAALRRLCDWICSSRRPDGFIGDFEEEKRLWYTASYPLRTLLAGGRMLEEPRYWDAAFHLIDLFVSEQMPEGGFTQAYRALPTARATEAALEEARRTNWMNLADVGSMVAALVVAAPAARGGRRERYLAAARRYLNEWAMRYRQPNGGFTNGWVLRPAAKVYSVSTASTALSLALFFRLTGERRYLHIAEDAVRLLIKDWNPDGRNWNFVFDDAYPGHDHYQGVNEFGDGFYTLEAMMALLEISRDPELRREIVAALRRYLFGEKGLFAYQGDRPWWPLQNSWHNSKSAGNPILLHNLLRFGPDFGVPPEELRRAKRALALCEKFLCEPRWAVRLGVAPPEPAGDYPFGVHSIQSWTGCAAAATGFAGIALAHLIGPSCVFLAPDGSAGEGTA